MFKTHKYAYINIGLLFLICIAFLFSTNESVHAVMGRAVSNPVYRAAGNGISLVSWFEGDIALLDDCGAYS